MGVEKKGRSSHSSTVIVVVCMSIVTVRGELEVPKAIAGSFPLVEPSSLISLRIVGDSKLC